MDQHQPPEPALILPVAYRPRVPYSGMAAAFLVVAATYYLGNLSDLNGQVPKVFNWDGEAVGWVRETPFTSGLPFFYGFVSAGLLFGLAHRIAPRSVAMVQPPTPLAGFIDHLARATAVSLLELTGAYMAYIGMAIQIGLVFIAEGQAINGAHRTFNNTWFMAGLLAYATMAGLILLAMNRDAKHGEYGECALHPGEFLPPSHGPETRPQPRRRPARVAPSTGQSKGLVD